LLNLLHVKKRVEPIPLFTLARSLNAISNMKFDKEKSIWKKYIEDEPEHLEKCLEKDLEFGKLKKLAKNE